MQTIKLLLSFFVSFTLLSGQASAAPKVLDPDPPGTPLIDDSAPAVSDRDAAERLDAFGERFGNFRSESYKSALLAEAQKFLATHGSQLSGGEGENGMPKWKSLGPTSAQYETNGVTLAVSDSGRVRRVLQNRKDQDTVYVLTAGGGLWVTRNFSDRIAEWQPLTDSQVNTSGGSFAMGGKANTLYLGIGDPFDGIPTLSGGMIMSKNGGKSWSPFLSLPGSYSVMDVAVDTSTSVDIVLVATDVGVFRSGNGGASYVPVLSGTVWSFAKTSTGWLASGFGASGFGVIYRSTDKGLTWQPIPNGGNVLSGTSRTTLGVAVPGDTVVYAFAQSGYTGNQLDLFRSVDGGLNWTALGITSKTPTNPNGFQFNMDIMRGQAFYNQMLLVDPSDPTRNTVYIGGQFASAKTMDGGATWTLISDWLPGFYSNLPYVHADHHTASTIYIDDKPAIIFGTDGGIFLSRDGGASFDFQKNIGIVSMLAQTIVSSGNYPQSFMMGMQDAGTRARLNATSVFNQVTGGDGEGVGWSQANNLVALTSFQGGGILHADNLKPDTIGNWRFVSPQFRFGDTRPFFTNIATPVSVADPTGLIFLTATRNRLYLTVDGAQSRASWFVIGRSGGHWPSDFNVRDVHHGIGLDPTAEFAKDGPYGSLAVVGYRGQVMHTVDGAYTWQRSKLIGLVPGWQGFNSTAAWTTTGALYIGSESPIPGSARAARSLDGGLTWARADNGLPDVAIYQIAIDPSDTLGKTLYAGTALGMFRTTDGGANWTLFGAGLPTVRVMGISVSANGDVVRVATYGRGAWEINARGNQDNE